MKFPTRRLVPPWKSCRLTSLSIGKNTRRFRQKWNTVWPNGESLWFPFLTGCANGETKTDYNRMFYVYYPSPDGEGLFFTIFPFITWLCGKDLTGPFMPPSPKRKSRTVSFTNYAIPASMCVTRTWVRLWQTWSMPLWTSRQLWLPLAEIRFSIFCSLDGMQFRSYEFALNATFSCPSLRGCGLSRRFAPRNHHVFSHHDKRKCDIPEVWQKFDVISASIRKRRSTTIWKNYKI